MTTPAATSARESLSREIRVRAACVELVYELTPRSLLASLAVSVLCALFFSPGRPPLAMAAWWLALTAVTAVRYGLVRRFRASQPDPVEARLWARRAAFGAGAAGTLWGVFLLVLVPAWGDPGFPLAVFMAAGIPAVGLASNTALFPVYAAFLLPILIPYSAKAAYVAHGEAFQVLGALAAVIYCAVLAAIGRAASRTIAEGFELRFRNLDLVAKVTRANEDLRTEIERRERAERVLVTAKEAAESASVAKSRFLAKMSHEIRTPLNGIIGMTELLKDSGLGARQARFAGHVDEAAHSLLRIVNDILDVSRVEAGRLKLETKAFDLRATVVGAVRMLEESARKKGLKLETEIAGGVPATVSGDPGRLCQVIVNLVGNALKFTDEGEVRVRVDLARPPAAEGSLLRFEVRDTGIGIPENQQDQLFEPFTQVDDSESRSFGGTGLGLAICRQLVDLMGGSIGVESRPGAGTLLWFTARFASASAAAPEGDEVEPPAPLRPLFGRVLLVEDNPVNREITEAALASLGCDVESTEDGIAAVSLAARKRYDAIIMDCEMPGLDGYGATRAIRVAEAAARASGSRRVPIIALTASALPTDRSRALESGMDEHLPKPFTRRDLWRALERWLACAVSSADSSDLGVAS